MMIMMTRGGTIPQTMDLASKNMKRILEKAMLQTLFKTIWENLLGTPFRMKMLI
jgi:hypothetical protein